MNNKIEVTFRRKDDWLFELVERIVTVKRAAGMQTSRSRELVRMAKNGLLGTMKGGENDRSAIKEGKLDVLPEDID